MDNTLQNNPIVILNPCSENLLGLADRAVSLL